MRLVPFLTVTRSTTNPLFILVGERLSGKKIVSLPVTAGRWVKRAEAAAT